MRSALRLGGRILSRPLVSRALPRVAIRLSSTASSSPIAVDSSTGRCSICKNPHCTPGAHCALGWKDPAKPNKASTMPSPSGPTALEAAAQVYVPTYVKPPVIFVSGKGCYLYDDKGTEYIDFTAGIAVTSLGHSDPGVVKAISEQASKMLHSSNLFHTAPAIKLAHALVAKSTFDKVFFANTGTEANEAALKFSRKYSRLHFGGDKEGFCKTEFIAFTHGFSGRSMGSLSATHKKKYRSPFEPLVPGVHFAEFNDLASVAKVMSSSRTCAVIVEPIQGEGGITPAAPDFLRGLRALCDKNDVLLIADEVQCGLGRTGSLWAHSAYGIQPDIMTLAKPLANGLPIGATLVVEKVAQAIEPGEHGSTYAGGPLVTHVAAHVLERISQPSFLEEVTRKGEYLIEKIKELDPKNEKIREIRSPGGLFIGVEFYKPVKDLVSKAMDRKVLLVNAGENVLRLCPPLTVTTEEIDKVVAVIKECMAD